MFDVKGDNRQAGQKLLAELIVGKNFQKVFNMNKGSIPARVDVALDDFDTCAHISAQDMATSNAGGSLLPSYAHGMALRGAQSGAITDVVTAHFNSECLRLKLLKCLQNRSQTACNIYILHRRLQVEDLCEASHD